MGENESCKKSALNSPKASSSSSANMMTMNILSQRTRKPLDKNCSGKAEKKQRRESSPQVEILCQVGTEKSHVHNLPSEMLMKILKNLDFQSLLHCRLMSVNWNAVATDVCRSRSDLCLQFNYYSDPIKKTVIENKVRNTSLVEFIESFGSSKHFPFARFHFDGVTWSMFRNEEWTEFLSTFGENIKGLKFTSSNYLAKNRNAGKDKRLLKFVEELRDLLLNQLPKLQEFGLQFHPCDPKSSFNFTVFRLFSKPRPINSADSDSQIATPSSVSKEEQQQLSHLKVLYLDEYMFSDYKEIVTDLLLAAVKLQKIQPFTTGLEKFNDEKTFFFLQSLGKLDCLESAEIHLTSEFLSQVKVKVKASTEKSTTLAPLAFKLKALDLKMDSTYENPRVWSDATIYLSTLFESCKNTLRELKISPLGFLENLPLPKFIRLTNLVVDNQNSSTIKTSIFPPGIQLNSIFPALNSLNLEIPWATAFPHENSISAIPNLRTLKIFADDVNDSVIEQISFMCPDLKNFSICDGRKGPLKNFPEVGTTIWTHLTKLQSLEISIHVGSEANPHAFDSCITGFSTEDSLRLSELTKGVQLLRNWGIEGRISKSEMTAQREKPSILNLKDLKDLKICLTFPGPFPADDESRQNLIQTAISCISKEHALNLMENLTYEITV